MTTLAEIKIGECFKVADIEFIKTGEENGQVAAVAKNSLFNLRFGDNNNFGESNVKKKLETEVLSRIEEAVGAENIIEQEVDLTALDGSDEYGKVKCKISLPTLDWFRKNHELAKKIFAGKWSWLVTPWSTKQYGWEYSVLCVSPLGVINYFNSFCGNIGVRPFIIFVSSISVISESCEG